ncbi:RagB/SusD family nutrient uptake outer membrane protein, partial [Bacteroides cellulosilyticus]
TNPWGTETHTGRITKGAAYGLLARAMLYAERWKAASDAALEVKKLGYKLYKNPSRGDKGYGELFTNRRSSVISNQESIIEFGYSYDNKMDYSFDYFYCPPSDGGYAEASPTEDLVSAYQMADGRDFDWTDPVMAANPYSGREPRFYASILYNGCQWKGQTLYTYEGSTDGYALGGGTTCTGYYMRKLFDEALPKNGMRSTDLTYYYMRYAEVLLIYAEAMAQQDGGLKEALNALNEIRARVDLPAVSASTKTEFMKLLRRERMIELAFEGHRFWDLRRWGLGTTVLNGTHMKGVKPTKVGDNFEYQLVDCDGGSTRVYLEKYNRFPIPLGELQQNTSCEQFDEWK